MLVAHSEKASVLVESPHKWQANRFSFRLNGWSFRYPGRIRRVSLRVIINGGATSSLSNLGHQLWQVQQDSTRTHSPPLAWIFSKHFPIRLTGGNASKRMHQQTLRLGQASMRHRLDIAYLSEMQTNQCLANQINCHSLRSFKCLDYRSALVFSHPCRSEALIQMLRSIQ